MVTSLHRDAVVAPDGTIAIHVPELAPGRRVRVTIEQESTMPQRHAIDMLETTIGHGSFTTVEDVDAYVRTERDAWDR
jgi:hypothetical protein